MRQRKLGPYLNVGVVDVTGLSCSVLVHALDSPEATGAVEGPMLQIRRVRADITTRHDGTTLVLHSGSGPVRVSNTGPAVTGAGGSANTGIQGAPRGGSIRVSNTGAAVAGPGGVANSGVSFSDSQPPRAHVVRPGKSFRHKVDGSSVTVTMFVRAGTRVLY